MYKALAFFALIVIGLASASRPLIIQREAGQRSSWKLKPANNNLDLCHYCVDEAVQAINVIVNLILDEEIFDTCSDLCKAVANKSGSSTIGEACTIICDTFGFTEFI
ncbi:unnamed protein product [Rotaria sp. Silwood2]|nr:unnamed protein product [Rotaria sp. Silwood2]CAF3069929.1 unnamed protein product [Rotaria sp. Silwood2]CAF3294327.1 unnamed protein product [Rotaria sp. Silwood2]CAF3415751.1 unnamed protein product [Rotaria sp. Silwood2]CAF4232851.1 unnamed protein product [Rotaria sp. Silwood2]